jgi:predicted transcriptional regulator of viral defense system
MLDELHFSLTQKLLAIFLEQHLIIGFEEARDIVEFSKLVIEVLVSQCFIVG